MYLVAISSDGFRGLDVGFRIFRMPKQRQGFVDPNAERVRTHLFFSSKVPRNPSRRRRRPQNKLHQLMHRKDEMVQTAPAELEPSLWSGNQRVLHFGPMAQRDPFFYYYPKGWDVLYPAHFGFFPYRATKFRGSSSAICISAFGTFLSLGGALMLLLAHFSMDNSPLFNLEYYYQKPIQLAGSVFLICGGILVLISLFCIMLSVKILSEDISAELGRRRFTILKQAIRPPYQSIPPPAYPVLENKYTQMTVFSPKSELKLYPPVMPGCSTLSLHDRSSSSYFASPYNTLRAVSATVQTDIVKENPRASSLIGMRKLSNDSVQAPRRAKSLAASSTRIEKTDRNSHRKQKKSFYYITGCYQELHQANIGINARRIYTDFYLIKAVPLCSLSLMMVQKTLANI
ncbi:2,3-bisphosphoglycerate-independent phosphoglycerate mutase [Dirofilaria immitis]